MSVGERDKVPVWASAGCRRKAGSSAPHSRNYVLSGEEATTTAKKIPPTNEQEIGAGAGKILLMRDTTVMLLRWHVCVCVGNRFRAELAAAGTQHIIDLLFTLTEIVQQQTNQFELVD